MRVFRVLLRIKAGGLVDAKLKTEALIVLRGHKQIILTYAMGSMIYFLIASPPNPKNASATPTLCSGCRVWPNRNTDAKIVKNLRVVVSVASVRALNVVSCKKSNHMVFKWSGWLSAEEHRNKYNSNKINT